MAEDRWLTRDEVAAYIKKRVDYLPRLQKAGKLPKPSYLFGPKSPLWDRHLIDLALSGNVSTEVDGIVEGIADEIRAGSLKGRHKNTRGRHP
jgi:hypothetical protein